MISTARIDGERHDLWWEFSLRDTFQWAALTAGLERDTWTARMEWLALALEIGNWLESPAAAVPPDVRALADLAVALLPGPSRLVWTHPFAGLSLEQRRRAARLLGALALTEGLTVELKEESNDERDQPQRHLHVDRRSAAGAARGWTHAHGASRSRPRPLDRRRAGLSLRAGASAEGGAGA